MALLMLGLMAHLHVIVIQSHVFSFILSLVFGFTQTTFSGMERSQSYSFLEVGFLSGYNPENDVPFNIQLNPGSASKWM